MKPSSRIWRETLKLAEAGIKPRDWPRDLGATTDGATTESIGFYKLPRKERKLNAKGEHNGQWKLVGYDPVAVTIVDGALTVLFGDRVVSQNQADDKFLWYISHPISEEEYREVVEQGLPFREFRAAALAAEVFPDPEPDAIPGAPTFDSGNPSIVMEPKAAPPQDVIKKRLDALNGQVAPFLKIESDEQSSAARGLQAKFLELRGEAAGHYEEANRPLLEQQKALRAIWFPLRDEADEAKTALGDAMGAWEDVKRAAAKRAADEAARLAREHEAAVRAAEAANRPAPAAPPPEVVSNAPAPAAQIKAPGARTANVKLAKIVTEIDVDKAFAQFRAAPEVREVLMALAQRAVTAGLPVEGAVVEERSKVR